MHHKKFMHCLSTHWIIIHISKTSFYVTVTINCQLYASSPTNKVELKNIFLDTFQRKPISTYFKPDCIEEELYAIIKVMKTTSQHNLTTQNITYGQQYKYQNPAIPLKNRQNIKQIV